MHPRTRSQSVRIFAKPLHPSAPLRLLLASLSALCVLLPPTASATNGYFSDGYGAKAEGQAGVGIAWAQDSLAPATNPAGIAFVGDRVDLGLAWFLPRRSADIVGNAVSADASYSGDGKKNFFIPEFGYAKQLSSTLGAGVAVYGNGGLNTQYAVNPYGRFGASGTAGVDLEQLFVSPALAWKPSAGQSLGVALNIAYQRFSAQGIGFFGGFSAAPANVSDQGTDTSLGVGLRLGWTGTLAPGLTAGLTWASKVHGKFDKYRGLFADGGRFDVPDNYGAGIAWRPDAAWTIGADVQTIEYNHVAAVGDPVASLLQGVPLGAPGGPGFGWRNVTVFKLGAAYLLAPDFALRAGYSHAGRTVPGDQTFFNILAPGVVQDHVTIGASKSFAGAGELSGFFANAPGKTVNGGGSIPPSFGGGEANVRLKETIIGVSYGWTL
jgi:long-chain fatty acid transport protein